MTNRLALIAACVLLAVASSWLGFRLAESDSRIRRTDQASLPVLVRAALDEPDAIIRTAQLTRILRDVRAEDFGSIAAVYEERFELVPPRPTSVELLGEAWAALDPENAIDRMNFWPEEIRGPALAAVTRAWARREPTAAFTWAETLDVRDRQAAMDGVFLGWAESGEPAIWTFLATLTPGFDRESATNIVMAAIVQRHGFDALFEQVDAIQTKFKPGSPQDFKLSALRTAVGLCAYHDPDKALKHALQYAGGPYDNGLLRRVAVYWAVNDGARAMNTLVALPAGAQRDKALRDGYIKWLRTRGAAALDWMPAEAANDERYAPLIDLYVIAAAQRKSEDPTVPIAQALGWIDRIGDPAIRRQSAILVATLWLHYEPEAAQAWIDERGIAPEVAVERRRRAAIEQAGALLTSGKRRKKASRDSQN